MSTINVRTARDVEARTVLRLILAVPGQSAGDIERQVSSFMDYARALSLDLNRQWMAERDGHCVSACTCLESPGRTALLFVPHGATTGCDAETIAHILQHVVRDVSTRMSRVVQCLVAPNDDKNQQALLQSRFRQLAVLRYLECDLTDSSNRGSPTASPGGSLEWVTYDRERHDDFAKLILATYQDSQDCRGLAGVRTIEDIIAGHKATGRFEPHRWSMLLSDERPAACVLLVANPLRPTLELAYMGVHPDFRRCGMGRYVLEHGLVQARRERFSAVTLAVDASNTPARRLYEGRRFRQTLERRAMICLLNSSP
ncbi:MAG: GNAT family N-acetyltransferase [Planctomycetota bacterium]|nr:GNAT family N-acetyltransferase [Planctomycetota bacterium]